MSDNRYDDHHVTYPREDKCRICGAHVGTILNELGEMFALGICDECSDEGPEGLEEDEEEDEEPQETRGQMHEADDEAMDCWAERYDELNGGPENDDDR